jgi:hypothetical protein
MHSVYKTQHVAGLGSALIIICDGQQDYVRFVELHIISRHATCSLISRLLTTKESKNAVTDDDLRGYALSWASAHLQSQADERIGSSIDAHKFAPVVTVDLGDDGDLRALRYAGVGTKELYDITGKTHCAELRELISTLWPLPVISVQDL